MNTWGPSKKPRARSNRRWPTGRAKSRLVEVVSSKSSSSSSRRRAARQHPRPHAAQHPAAQATPTELRERGRGKEHDLTGVVLIGAGMVLALAMYFDLGGPLGARARHVRRLVLRARLGSCSRSRSSRSASPSSARAARRARSRLVLGWGLVAAAVTGTAARDPQSRFVHRHGRARRGRRVVRRGARRADRDADRRAGCGRRDARARCRRGAADHADSLRTMATHTGRGVGAVAKPLGQYTKRALSDLSTLSSEREGGEHEEAEARQLG